MTDAAASVDAHNIERLIEAFAALSEPGEGVTRLGYSALERQAHDLFASEMAGLGLKAAVDAAGNTIAELSPASASGARAIGTGSHLDSVPSGGRFDGIAGVCAAIETARVVVESGSAIRRPWRFVVFAAEEGARFGQACTGSRVIAGLTGAGDLDAFHDKDGVSLRQAMAEVGLDPAGCASAVWDPDEWHAFVELHIEQGNVLESSGTPIGVVESISGSSRLLVTLTGTASHTGGTPMHLRRDALAAAAECVLAGERLAKDREHHGTRVTVGRLDVHPGSITTIPGEVVFSVDVRDLDSQRQRSTARELLARFEGIAAERGVGIRSEVIGDTSPVILPTWVADAIAGAAVAEGLGYRMMSSGASHDAQQISRVTSTGMIFVPSKDGLSHVPEEWTSSQELAEGTRVLVRTLSALDAEEDRR